VAREAALDDVRNWQLMHLFRAQNSGQHQPLAASLPVVRLRLAVVVAFTVDRHGGPTCRTDQRHDRLTAGPALPCPIP
jgi:hypothetical protein